MKTTRQVETTIRTKFSTEEVSNALFERLKDGQRLPGSPTLKIESFDGAFVLIQKQSNTEEI